MRLRERVATSRDVRSTFAPSRACSGCLRPSPACIRPGRPGRCGGNIDCTELVAGTKLFLPIPVDGALFSAGDGHARQGDGEVSQTAIECGLDRLQLTLTVRDEPQLDTPLAWTPEAWVTFGFDEDLDTAAAIATRAMLDLMERELALERREALGACQRRRRPTGDAGCQRRPGCARSPPPRRDKNLTVAYEFKLPDLGEGLTEGEIARWLVSEGQEIGEDDPLVEIQTDKTTVEIPSPAAGTVTSILVEEGKVVPVGTVLVVIGGDSGDGAPRVEPERPAVSQPAPAAKGRATPLVRKIAQELGVDLDSLTGTGPQGRVTEEDVRGAAAPGEGTARASARGAARDRRAHGASPSRGPCRDLGRGVRLLGGRPRRCSCRPCSRPSPSRCRSSRS